MTAAGCAFCKSENHGTRSWDSVTKLQILFQTAHILIRRKLEVIKIRFYLTLIIDRFEEKSTEE